MAGLSSEESQQKLEDLTQFAAFFEFFTQPEKYQEIIKAAQEVLAEQVKIIGPYTTVERAQAYLAAAEKKVAEVNSFMDTEKAALAAAQEKQVVINSAVADALAAREIEVTKRQENLATEIKRFQQQQSISDKRSSELDDKETVLVHQAELLSARELDLARRLTAMADLVK